MPQNFSMEGINFWMDYYTLLHLSFSKEELNWWMARICVYKELSKAKAAIFAKIRKSVDFANTDTIIQKIQWNSFWTEILILE